MKTKRDRCIDESEEDMLNPDPGCQSLRLSLDLLERRVNEEAGR